MRKLGLVHLPNHVQYLLDHLHDNILSNFHIFHFHILLHLKNEFTFTGIMILLTRKSRWSLSVQEKITLSVQ